MNPASSPTSNHLQTASPSEDGVYQAELSNSSRDSAPAKPPQRSAATRITLMLLFCVGVAAPAIWFWLPSEQANWRVAAAQAKWFEDDKAAAMQILDAAVIEFPDSATVLRQRAEFQIKTEQYEQALVDVERLVQLSPKSPDSLELQSQVLHHLERHDDAILVCKEVLRLAEEEWIGNSAFAMNALAYAYAIGDKDHDVALAHINEAIRLAGANPGLLDTRGYLLYRSGEAKAALEDMEPAVASFDKYVASTRAAMQSSVSSFNTQQDLEAAERSLAVLLYHRSLVYDRLNQRDEAKVDRERVRTLGYEPNEKLF